MLVMMDWFHPCFRRQSVFKSQEAVVIYTTHIPKDFHFQAIFSLIRNKNKSLQGHLNNIQKLVEHLTLNEFETILLSDCYGYIWTVSKDFIVPLKTIKLGCLWSQDAVLLSLWHQYRNLRLSKRKADLIFTQWASLWVCPQLWRDQDQHFHQKFILTILKAHCMNII